MSGLIEENRRENDPRLEYDPTIPVVNNAAFQPPPPAPPPLEPAFTPPVDNPDFIPDAQTAPNTVQSGQLVSSGVIPNDFADKAMDDVLQRRDWLVARQAEYQLPYYVDFTPIQSLEQVYDIQPYRGGVVLPPEPGTGETDAQVAARMREMLAKGLNTDPTRNVNDDTGGWDFFEQARGVFSFGKRLMDAVTTFTGKVASHVPSSMLGIGATAVGGSFGTSSVLPPIKSNTTNTKLDIGAIARESWDSAFNFNKRPLTKDEMSVIRGLQPVDGKVDVSKARFGDYGSGVIGAVNYGLDNLLDGNVFRAIIADIGGNLSRIRKGEAPDWSSVSRAITAGKSYSFLDPNSPNSVLGTNAKGAEFWTRVGAGFILDTLTSLNPLGAGRKALALATRKGITQATRKAAIASAIREVVDGLDSPLANIVTGLKKAPTNTPKLNVFENPNLKPRPTLPNQPPKTVGDDTLRKVIKDGAATVSKEGLIQVTKPDVITDVFPVIRSNQLVPPNPQSSVYGAIKTFQPGDMVDTSVLKLAARSDQDLTALGKFMGHVSPTAEVLTPDEILQLQKKHGPIYSGVGHPIDANQLDNYLKRGTGLLEVSDNQFALIRRVDDNPIIITPQKPIIDVVESRVNYNMTTLRNLLDDATNLRMQVADDIRRLSSKLRVDVTPLDIGTYERGLLNDRVLDITLNRPRVKVTPTKNVLSQFANTTFYHGTKFDIDSLKGVNAGLITPTRNPLGIGYVFSNDQTLAREYAKAAIPNNVPVSDIPVNEVGVVRTIKPTVSNPLDSNEIMTSQVKEVFVQAARDAGFESDVVQNYTRRLENKEVASAWSELAISYAKTNRRTSIPEDKFRLFELNVQDGLKTRGYDSVVHKTKSGKTTLVVFEPDGFEEIAAPIKVGDGSLLEQSASAFNVANSHREVVDNTVTRVHALDARIRLGKEMSDQIDDVVQAVDQDASAALSEMIRRDALLEQTADTERAQRIRTAVEKGKREFKTEMVQLVKDDFPGCL